MGDTNKNLTRRNFLKATGVAGSAAAVQGMMGRTAANPSQAGLGAVKPGSGKGKTALVLGAGVGGLTTAYRLLQAGFEVTVLEAQNRPGGRNFTARQGDEIFDDVAGKQTCKFDKDLYANMGPGRIPYHHVRVLNLCRELKVPLEVYVHTSAANFHVPRNAQRQRPVPRRHFAYDSQGFLAELLAREINAGRVHLGEMAGHKDVLLNFLQKFGSLTDQYEYKGSTRSGCAVPPTVFRNCRIPEKLDWKTLLDSRFWDPCELGDPPPAGCKPNDRPYGFYQQDENLWHTTSFQPVDGMDKIIDGLMAKPVRDKTLRDRTTCGAQVTGIRFAENKVNVVYRHKGQNKHLTADYCVSNIPLAVLRGIPAPNFSRDFREAINRPGRNNACKVGWQANQRFWESSDQIYGGISWIAHPITQMWYPSNDYFDESGKGVLTGAYNYGETARRFGNLSLSQRLIVARQGGLLLHPEAFRNDAIVPHAKGVSIAWQNVPFVKACSMNWRGSADTRYYQRLLRPDGGGRFFIVGDQVSTVPGWQEGALMSAEHVLDQITNRPFTQQEILKEVDTAPVTRDLAG